MKIRLDQYLVQHGLTQSRERAKALIMSGIVFVNEQKVDKAGEMIKEDAKVEVRGHDIGYVSRGGLKLEKAMKCFPLTPKGKVCMDIGASTGGFTDCLLQAGAARVVGVEGLKELTRRAEENAAANGLAANVSFGVANLFECTPKSLGALGHFDKMLIDPPREGAVEVVKALGEDSPGRIVYVSCNPSTLARDAAILVHQKGYRFSGAGIVNMFPHTSHVESIALFEKA